MYSVMVGVVLVVLFLTAVVYLVDTDDTKSP
jgi:hypothetical protein